jgi:hypothetical protein
LKGHVILKEEEMGSWEAHETIEVGSGLGLEWVDKSV